MTKAKAKRHKELMAKITGNPFLKDEDLAKAFNVSVATIRCDRAELGIAEYRERIKSAAKHKIDHPMQTEMLELNLFQNGISILDTDGTMTFKGTNIVKSQYIYAFAENLALSVVDAKAALVKVANVKYIKQVLAGEKLMARSEVIRAQDKEYIVHVRIRSNMNEVFRGKFSLSELEVF